MSLHLSEDLGKLRGPDIIASCKCFNSSSSWSSSTGSKVTRAFPKRINKDVLVESNINIEHEDLTLHIPLPVISPGITVSPGQTRVNQFLVILIIEEVCLSHYPGARKARIVRRSSAQCGSSKQG